ncbi:MAG: S-adenosyl-l-methionine hydroxide adenosyltransferase family protein [Candidatus Bathyarchaeia archaeon]|jgi:S-adenosylmethionine hydrolase
MSTQSPVISLLSDFGLVDPFVAEMKAVILSICPMARIVDISHEVDKFSIRMGAFLLAEAAPAFQEGAVHVAVVDPGVGGSRRAIVIKTRRAAYVGPDNGLLLPAALSDGLLGVFEITNRSMMRREISLTFHGRDIFAPAAAHLASGRLPEEFGPEITEYVKSPYSEPVFERNAVICEILHVDRFGNIVTNLSQNSLSQHNNNLTDKIILSVGSRKFSARIVGTFSDLREGEIGALFGSHGFLEVAAREKSAAEKLRVNRGIPVHIHLSN